jgi:reactive intermediate/imine deaminase
MQIAANLHHKQKFMNQPSPSSGLPFSKAVASRGMLYISGQIGIDPTTNSLPSTSFEAEADQVMKNLGEVLHGFGLTHDNLINVTIYLKSMGNYSATNTVYIRYFNGNFPARVCIAVHDLPLNANIEVAAIAEMK